jgi:hypothetical protein
VLQQQVWKNFSEERIKEKMKEGLSDKDREPGGGS